MTLQATRSAARTISSSAPNARIAASQEATMAETPADGRHGEPEREPARRRRTR